MATSSDTIRTRPSLLKRLRDLGDHTSWSEFFEIYWRLIFNVALKAGLTESEAEDVVQEAMLSVAKLMPDFKYNPAIGSFRGFLLQVTRRRIVDQFRKRKPEICASDFINGGDASSIEALPLPVESKLQAIWEAEWKNNLIEQATERVKRRAEPLNYQLFHLFVIERWTVKDIMKTMGLSEHLVYKSKERISKLIQKELQRLQEKVI